MWIKSRWNQDQNQNIHFRDETFPRFYSFCRWCKIIEGECLRFSSYQKSQWRLVFGGELICLGSSDIWTRITLVLQTVSGDLERECIEESCDDQEFHEVYDDLSISEPKYIKYLDCLNYINKSDRQTERGKGTGWIFTPNSDNIPVIRRLLVWPWKRLAPRMCQRLKSRPATSSGATTTSEATATTASSSHGATSLPSNYNTNWVAIDWNSNSSTWK